MSWAEIKVFIDNFRTDQIMQTLQAWNIGELNSNPWVLGGLAAAVLLTYFLGLRVISACIVGIGGFALALSWAVGQGTGTEGLAGGGLYVIIGGGTIAIGLCIYLLFIKSE